MRKFNEGEMTDSLLVPVFTKLGQNPFSDQNESELKGWLDSLNANALYKSLMEATTEMDLAVQ